MASKRVEFMGGNGHVLAGILDLPSEGRPSAWGIFAHCFTCGKDLKPIVNIDRALNEQGMAVLRFDFTGLGESGGRFVETNFSSNVGDLVAASEILGTRYEAPKFLIGHSLGGAAAIKAAGRIPGCRAVVTIAATSDPAGLRGLFKGKEEEMAESGEASVMVAGRPFTFKKQFLDDITGADLGEDIQNLGRPILILHSPLDDTVDIENAARIFQSARHPKSFISLDGADHLLLKESDSRFAGAMIGTWVSRYI
jgi:putative redox protein